MNDSLKKIKVTPASLLEGSQLLSEKDSVKLIKAKELKNAVLKQIDSKSLVEKGDKSLGQLLRQSSHLNPWLS